MKKILILLSLMNTVFPAGQLANRARVIKVSDMKGSIQATNILTYDSAGNIVSIATFEASGILVRTRYYFYRDNCIDKINEYANEKLVSTRHYISVFDCKPVLEKQFNANKKLVQYQYFLYENDRLVSFSEFDTFAQPTGKSSFTYEDGLLRSVRYENSVTKQKLSYLYDKNRILLSIEQTVNFKNQAPIKSRLTIDYDSGPQTPEAARYIFE